MSLPKWANHKIIVVTPGTKSVYGSDTEDWSDAAVTRREIEGCWVWPASAEELRDRGRDTTITAKNVNLPPSATEIPDNCRVELPPRYKQYEILGEVVDYPSATGHLGYRNFYAERIENRG